MTVGGETVTVYNDDFFDKIRQKHGVSSSMVDRE
eukprot:CAMPEP_0172181004 /NCGR_PEP_ID=MMETSP1050-20130122/17570_1 /TAXON_ID=233186 /ORGANISM="Cryptomonas curvata, Strain CCAP979/52" /LENGTH=33 /DNA_ID= /DNA_START= /DNA_END= /DNA_ORIENTATION=